MSRGDLAVQRARTEDGAQAAPQRIVPGGVAVTLDRSFLPVHEATITSRPLDHKTMGRHGHVLCSRFKPPALREAHLQPPEVVGSDQGHEGGRQVAKDGAADVARHGKVSLELGLGLGFGGPIQG